VRGVSGRGEPLLSRAYAGENSPTVNVMQQAIYICSRHAHARQRVYAKRCRLCRTLARYALVVSPVPMESVAATLRHTEAYLCCSQRYHASAAVVICYFARFAAPCATLLLVVVVCRPTPLMLRLPSLLLFILPTEARHQRYPEGYVHLRRDV